MNNRWAGISTTGSVLNIVVIDFDAAGKPKVIDDENWKLQDGDRPQAYRTLFERLRNYLAENAIGSVVIKGSAPTQAKATMALLEGAETRGVVIAAAASVPNMSVHSLKKQTVSRQFGERDADGYAKDNDFWAGQFDKDIKRGSRETALLILMARKQ